MNTRILESEDFPTEAIALLQGHGPVVLGPAPATDPDTEALFIRLANRIDAHYLARFPALRWLVSPTTGLDHIDLSHCAERGIAVISLKGRTEFLDRIHATAELTIALALALYRDLPAAAAAVREGTWDRYPHKGRELHGKTVLLLGYGRIGRLVAPLYRAFGCRVVAHDARQGRVPAEMRCAFPDVLGEIDVLSIHLSLDTGSRHLIDDALLARMRPEAIVVNTSRGEIVDQSALLRRLEQGHLSGAALDVLAGEPDPIDGVLLERFRAMQGRLLVTPHIGGFTHESLAAVEIFMTRVFLDAAFAGD